jgi:hypothetical protein
LENLAYSEGKLHQIRHSADGSVDSFSVYYKTIHSFCAVKGGLEPSAGTQF